MRSLPTAAVAATAAAMAALAITVTVPALGDDTDPTPDKPVASKQTGDEEATLRACLKAHGADVPDGDGRVLKNWIITSHTDAERAAIKDCGLADVPKPGEKGDHRPAGKIKGPDEATLRSCLKNHDVTVPEGDGLVLKRWIIGDHTTAEKDALKACGMEEMPKVAPGGGPCAEKPDRDVKAADGAVPAKKPEVAARN